MCIITFVGCFGFGLIVMKTCNWSIIRLSSSAVHPIKNHPYNIISASEIQQGIWQILNKMTVKTTNKLNIVIFSGKIYLLKLIIRVLLLQLKHITNLSHFHFNIWRTSMIATIRHPTLADCSVLSQIKHEHQRHTAL